MNDTPTADKDAGDEMSKSSAHSAEKDAGQKFSGPECHAGAPNGLLLVRGNQPAATGGHHGNTAGRQCSQGNNQHGQGDGAQREESPVPQVRPEVSTSAPLGRSDVRHSLPLGGLQLRVDDHARLGVAVRCSCGHDDGDHSPSGACRFWCHTAADWPEKVACNRVFPSAVDQGDE